MGEVFIEIKRGAGAWAQKNSDLSLADANSVTGQTIPVCYSWEKGHLSVLCTEVMLL